MVAATVTQVYLVTRIVMLKSSDNGQDSVKFLDWLQDFGEIVTAFSALLLVNLLFSFFGLRMKLR